MKTELPDGRRWNGLAYLHDTPRDGCSCPTCKQAQIDEAMSRRPFVPPVFTETPDPRNNTVTDKSDLIVPGTQPKLAGRSWPALTESKSYDEKRIAESPLFRETGKLF